MVSTDRVAEVIAYAREHGEQAALDEYSITAATLLRYRFLDKSPPKNTTGGVRILREAEGPNLNIVAESHEIRTLEQLLAYCRVDLGAWTVTRHIVNMWGGPDNPNFQVKAWLTLRGGVDPKEELADLIADAKQYAPKYPRLHAKARPKSGNMLELALFDHHFGQLSWGKETRGGNYDVKIAARLAIDAVDYLLTRASEVGIDKIVVPIGNDFFNVNSAANTTVAGTPQSEDVRWKKTYVLGRRLWVKIIERCLLLAPVEIKCVLGNHDGERSFYLTDALNCWFHKAPEVAVDNNPAERKYLEWGRCFIGWTHGNEEKKGTLVNIMATERPLEWSRTTYREWHKGHLHAAKAEAFQILDEDRGVRERVLPSLVAIDDWHAKKGYSALRESVAMVWNKDRGLTDEFYYHPE